MRFSQKVTLSHSSSGIRMEQLDFVIYLCYMFNCINYMFLNNVCFFKMVHESALLILNKTMYLILCIIR